MEEKNYQAIIEAILFTMGEAVPLERIADAIELDKKKTKAILKEMIESYKSDKTGISVIGWLLSDVHQAGDVRVPHKNCQTAAETRPYGCPFGDAVDHCLQAAGHARGD
jgi:hypothetical protein